MLVSLRKSKCDIYIGRRKPPNNLHYGNPFTKGTDKENKDSYELWLRGCMYLDVEQPRRRWILATLHNLKGKKLGCYCNLEYCHGIVLEDLMYESTSSFGESR